MHSPTIIKTNEYDASGSSSEFWNPQTRDLPQSARAVDPVPDRLQAKSTKIRPHTVSNSNLYRRKQELVQSSSTSVDSAALRASAKTFVPDTYLRPQPRLHNISSNLDPTINDIAGSKPSHHHRKSNRKHKKERHRPRHRHRNHDLPQIEERGESFNQHRASALVDSLSQQIADYSHGGLTKLKDMVKNVAGYVEQFTTSDDESRHSRYVSARDADTAQPSTQLSQQSGLSGLNQKHTHKKRPRKPVSTPYAAPIRSRTSRGVSGSNSLNPSHNISIRGVYRTMQDASHSIQVVQRMWFQTLFGVTVLVSLCTVLMFVPCTLSLVWMAMGWNNTTEGHYFWTVFSFFAIWIVLSLCACSLVSFIYSKRPVRG